MANQIKILCNIDQNIISQNFQLFYSIFPPYKKRAECPQYLPKYINFLSLGHIDLNISQILGAFMGTQLLKKIVAHFRKLDLITKVLRLLDD